MISFLSYWNREDEKKRMKRFAKMQNIFKISGKIKFFLFSSSLNKEDRELKTNDFIFILLE